MNAYQRLPAYMFVTAALVGVAGSAIVASLPTGSFTGQPPFWLFLAMGIGTIVLAALILQLAVKLGLPLKASTVGLILVFNALIAVVKFVVAPFGLYLANITGDGFTEGSALLSNTGYWLIGACVFLLYALVLFLLFRWVKGPKAGAKAQKRKRSVWHTAAIVTAIGIGLYVGSAYLLLVLFLLVGPTINYLSSTGPLFFVIAALLAIAIFVAAAAIKSARAEANQLRDAGLLASLFWLCLSIILLYHVLWVVFMTALITIWPFKTFAPGGK